MNVLYFNDFVTELSKWLSLLDLRNLARTCKHVRGHLYRSNKLLRQLQTVRKPKDVLKSGREDLLKLLFVTNKRKFTGNDIDRFIDKYSDTISVEASRVMCKYMNTDDMDFITRGFYRILVNLQIGEYFDKTWPKSPEKVVAFIKDIYIPLLTTSKPLDDICVLHNIGLKSVLEKYGINNNNHQCSCELSLKRIKTCIRRGVEGVVYPVSWTDMQLASLLEDGKLSWIQFHRIKLSRMIRVVKRYQILEVFSKHYFPAKGANPSLRKAIDRDIARALYKRINVIHWHFHAKIIRIMGCIPDKEISCVNLAHRKALERSGYPKVLLKCYDYEGDDILYFLFRDFKTF